MAYLVTHIAICLVFAQLLGLLLGWLLWGYVARQRGKEVQMLRERLADMHLMSARIAVSSEPRLALREVPDKLPGVLSDALIDADLPARTSVRRAFFEDAAEALEARPISVPPGTSPIAPDLEAEVKEARLQHLQQQVRELEGYRDRLPLLQADLSDALAGRNAAETRLQEAKNDFDVRSSGLLSQIRDFESAAGEWDRGREEFEREKINHEKELSAVKATLRDLQNSQHPQAADAPPAASDIELSDLRQRYQKAVRERDLNAAELELRKQGESGRPKDPGRLAELEEAVQNRDSQLSEQAARVESLLWRVAELEPFAAEATQNEEDFRRQESEIAGHMAMHSENAERIRSLQSHIAELQSTTIPSDELQRIVAEHQAEMQALSKDHQQNVAELKQSLAMKDDEISGHVSVRHEQTTALNSLQTRITELEAATQQTKVLEQLLTDRNSQHRAEVEGLSRDHRQRVAELQQSLAMKDDEISQHVSARHDQTNTLNGLQARMGELEAATQRMKTLEQLLADRGTQHQADLQVLSRDHQQRVAELQQSLATKDDEISQHVSARHDQTNTLNSLQARMGELEAATRQTKIAERLLADRDTEIRGLLAAHSETQQERETAHRELEKWKARATELEPLASREPELQAALSERTAELQRLKESNTDKDDQLTFLQERLVLLSSRLADHQQRLLQLEPLAARTPVVEEKLAEREQESREQLKALEDRHHTELTRLKVNSAQRIRRFRQSINAFKT